MLVRLLYASRSKEFISDAVSDSILASARKNNADQGITGILCIYESGDSYLQVLEGGREAVNRIYNQIVADPRHTDVTLLAYDDIQERRFSSWRMGKVDLGKVNRSTILRFSSSSKLDPLTLQGATALRLLEELVDTASISSQNDS